VTIGQYKKYNQLLKRTKYAVTFFAKTRKKTAIKFCPLAGRYGLLGH